ncbi:hypothetical protein HGP17_23140 [Rhizobium sp. P38BS-XIX]|uniref:hypothetical protein n=1 Tax=Rhizobium sp. P38BS-XIX TaxID=2726740 RepID=UPI00145709FC|nr:hypothetical protein [Rhizobium sp. P38BS-XIX]NLR99727.1 hypothetical protein [Rhizobium sp. P38BS-XIX]
MRVICDSHGDQGIGLACIHVAGAIDGEAISGCYCSSATDMARPDAWCQDCEAALLDQGWNEDWFKAADFKILCAACWDLASQRFGMVKSASTEV